MDSAAFFTSTPKTLGEASDDSIEPALFGSLLEVLLHLLHPGDEVVAPLGVGAPPVGEVLLGQHGVGDPPDAVAVLHEAGHGGGRVDDGLEEVRLAAVRVRG
jgi:hypothetical protein